MSEEVKDKLQELFNTPDIPKNTAITTVPEPTDIENDCEYAAEKFKHLIKIGEEVLGEAADNAVRTGQAEDVDAFAKLLKNVGEITKSILETAKVRKDIKKPDETPAPQTVNNTIMFSGNGKDMLENLKKKKVIDIENG